MRADGLSAQISSIHVNGWFGSYDKLAMCRLLLPSVSVFPWKPPAATSAFAGDSNDAPMFAFFENSVGWRTSRASPA
jgi:hypothetical protein